MITASASDRAFAIIDGNIGASPSEFKRTATANTPGCTCYQRSLTKKFHGDFWTKNRTTSETNKIIIGQFLSNAQVLLSLQDIGFQWSTDPIAVGLSHPVDTSTRRQPIDFVVPCKNLLAVRDLCSATPLVVVAAI